MMRCPLPWIAVLLVPAAIAAAEEADPNRAAADRVLVSGRTGLLTDRLTPKQVRVWQEMDRIALETRTGGDPIHPVLFDLYQWARSGNHRIYVEMPSRLNTGSPVSGRCIIEPPSPGGPRTARVLIFVETIELACTKRAGEPTGAFLPFENLTGARRFLETLAHELVHVRLNLSDPDYAALMDSGALAISQLLALNRLPAADPRRTAQLRGIQSRLDYLREAVEGPALEVERAVHGELLAASQARASRARH